jgi:hypothetical protein
MDVRGCVGLALVTAVYSLALSVFMAGGGLLLTGRVDWAGVVMSFPVAMAVMALTYIPHALAHIATAEDLGYEVSYRVVASKTLVAVVFSVLMAFPLVAPGRVAVYEREPELDDLIRQKIVQMDILLMASAGPLVNLINATIGLTTFLMTKVELMWLFGFVNAGFAMWSLLPFMEMDGERMMHDKLRWAEMMALAVLLLIMSVIIAIKTGTGDVSAWAL